MLEDAYRVGAARDTAILTLAMRCGRNVHRWRMELHFLRLLSHF